MKPNILICGLYGISDILRDALPEDFILESENDDAVTKDVEDQETNIVNRIVETPVANFIEANEICRFYPEGFPAGLSMGDYVKKIEAELESRKLLNGTEKKIDFVWYTSPSTSEAKPRSARTSRTRPRKITGSGINVAATCSTWRSLTGRTTTP